MSDFANNPVSLQEHCMTYIIAYLEQFSPASLALLPPRLASELASRLPLADLFHLENSAFANTLDFKKFWSSICAQALPEYSAESFYFMAQEWLKQLGIAQGSRELFVVHIANCALHSSYMPVGDILSLLLVRTSSSRDIESLLQLCSDDKVPSNTQPLVKHLSKGELIIYRGKSIGVVIPKRYLPYILQWNSPNLLPMMLAKVVKYCPTVVWVPEGVCGKHLMTIMGWKGIGKFLSGVEDFHLSLGKVGEDFKRKAHLAESLPSHSSALDVVRSQTALVKACSQLMWVVISQPITKIISLQQFPVSPQDLIQIIHAFLGRQPSQERKMILNQMYLMEPQSHTDTHTTTFYSKSAERSRRIQVLTRECTTSSRLKLTKKVCQRCQPRKYLMIISSPLTPEMVIAKHRHFHLKELHLNNPLSDFETLFSSPNFYCERLILENCTSLHSTISLGYLLTNSSLRAVEFREIDDPYFLKDITWSLESQSHLGTLTELSLISCNMHERDRCHSSLMQNFFTALFVLPQLDMFTLKLQHLRLKLSDVHLMLGVWLTFNPHRQLESLTIINSCCTVNAESAVKKLTKHLIFRPA